MKEPVTVFSDEILIETKGNCDLINITEQVSGCVRDSKVSNGICTVFCVGSTGAVTTIEYEPGLLKDFPDAMERVAPRNAEYQHHLMWGDGNGHSHIRASVLGPSLTVPVIDGRLSLGTWQQIVFADFDVRPRKRTIQVVIIGE